MSPTGQPDRIMAVPPRVASLAHLHSRSLALEGCDLTTLGHSPTSATSAPGSGPTIWTTQTAVSSPVSKRDTPVLYTALSNRMDPLADAFAVYSSSSQPETGDDNSDDGADDTIGDLDKDFSDDAQAGEYDDLDQYENSYSGGYHHDSIKEEDEENEDDYDEDYDFSAIPRPPSIPVLQDRRCSVMSLNPAASFEALHRHLILSSRDDRLCSVPNSPYSSPSRPVRTSSRAAPESGSHYQTATDRGDVLTPTSTSSPGSFIQPPTPQLSPRSSGRLTGADFFDVAPVTSPRPDPSPFVRSQLERPSVVPISAGPAGDNLACRTCGCASGFHQQHCPVSNMDRDPTTGFVSVFEDDDDRVGLMDFLRHRYRNRKSPQLPLSSSWAGGSGSRSPGGKRTSGATATKLPRFSVTDMVGSAGPEQRPWGHPRRWVHRLSCAVRGG